MSITRAIEEEIVASPRGPTIRRPGTSSTIRHQASACLSLFWLPTTKVQIWTSNQNVFHPAGPMKYKSQQARLVQVASGCVVAPGLARIMNDCAQESVAPGTPENQGFHSGPARPRAKVRLPRTFRANCLRQAGWQVPACSACSACSG